MDRKDDYKRTIAYGDAAINQLKANKTPAYPRNYELWYTYAAGFNKPLNEAVNAILRSQGRLSADETSEIYDKCLSPLRLSDRIDEVGGRVSAEIDRVMGLVEANVSSTTTYGASLEGASQALDHTQDSEQVRAIVQTLMSATKAIETSNKTLEAQLIESKRQIDVLQESLDSVRYESLTDELTTLANRKHFRMMLERTLREAEALKAPFSLLMADIDYFKQFNDTYGHQTGDQVLRLVAAAMTQSIKGKDLASRYGGEEFAIILPQTQLDHAVVVAEQIRTAVMTKELVKRSTGEQLGRITVSVGCAESQADDTAESIIARADAGLYAAKRSGRNQVSTDCSRAADMAQNVA